jgi:glycosyltransferase involved in cell wall biosynthesis
MRIAYIIGTFPSLTTTFIEREILEASNQGLDLVLISIRPAEQFAVSPDSRSLVARTRYVLPVHWGRLLSAHLHFVLARFNVYICTLLYLLTRPHASLQACLKTLFHFVEGVYAADFLRGENVDMIHAHFVDRAATLALVVARLLGLPYSFTAHARNIYVNPTLLPEKIAEARFVVTCTAYNKAYLERVGGACAVDKIHLVYHGLDLADFVPDERPATKTPRILAVGRLQEKKGFPYLVGACYLLKQRDHRFACEIVGEGPERAALEQLITSLGVEDSVHLSGRLPFSEVITRYRQADIFTLPCILAKDGDRDGIPNVLLEAMAMQLPVVTTRWSGIPELVEDGVTGLLIESGDEEALADALARLLEDVNLRESLGKAGRAKVARDFDVYRNVERLLALFSRYLAGQAEAQDRVIKRL